MTAYAVNKQTGFTANLYFYDDAKTVSTKLAGALVSCQPALDKLPRACFALPFAVFDKDIAA